MDVPRVGPSGGCRRGALRFARRTVAVTDRNVLGGPLEPCGTLDLVELAILKEHAVDIPDDRSGW